MSIAAAPQRRSPDPSAPSKPTPRTPQPAAREPAVVPTTHPTTRERLVAAFADRDETGHPPLPSTRQRLADRALSRRSVEAAGREPESPEPESQEPESQEPGGEQRRAFPCASPGRRHHPGVSRRTDRRRTAATPTRGPPSPAPLTRRSAIIIQTKPAVSRPGDALEREADALAARVLHADVRARGPPRPLTRASGTAATSVADALPPSVAAVVHQPGGGEPLETSVRTRLEPHVGVDLEDVRVRRDPDAVAAARDLQARAFVTGMTIFLGATSSPADLPLMAHEVAHVVQQQARPDARATLLRQQDDSPFAALPDWLREGITTAVQTIPGYTVLTAIIGTDPLTGQSTAVERQRLVELLLTYGPFGPAVGAVLQTIDVLGQVFDLITSQLTAHDLTLARVRGDLRRAWDEISITNSIATNVAIVNRYVDAFLRDVRAFVGSLVDRVLEIVRSVVARVAEPLLETPEIAPVWNLAKKVLHYDPLRGVEVHAATAEIIADFLRLIGQEQRLAQMQQRGTLQATADWLDTQLATFASLVGELGTLFSDAWAAIQPQNLPNLLDNLQSLAQRAFGFVQRVGAFAGTVILKILEIIKDALLGWLSENAHRITGFHLLTVIIGRNPFTGEVVPRTAENLIKGFITLLPSGEETYNQLAQSGVIADAAGRIEDAMARLGISLAMVTGLFHSIWDSLSLDDLLNPLAAFARILDQFGEPLSRLVQFVAVVVQVVIDLVLRLMNFPSDLLASIIAHATQAIEDIKRDPVAFLKNMLAAVKLGLSNFFDHILGHLARGLAAWLFRGLGQLGITIPSDFSLQSILTLVLQVLGISVESLWTKLGEHIGQDRVAMVRRTIDRLTGAWQFIKDVQEGGIGAVWRYVQQQLSTLWDTLLGMARDWIMRTIVDRVSARLLTLLDPTGVMAVVNGFIAFFNAVQSAIEYLRDILQIVDRYVSTLAAVAAGNIVPGAQMLEQGLAAAIPVAIGFLANQVGLGNIPEQVVAIIGQLRQLVDQALDWLIAQAVRLGQAALNALGLGPGQQQPATPAAAADVDEGFALGAEQHHIRAHIRDSGLQIRVASDDETPLWDKVELIEANWVRFWLASLEPAVQAKGAQLRARLQALRQMETTLVAQFAAETNPDARFRIEQDGTTALRVELSNIGRDFGLRGLHFEPPQHNFVPYPADSSGRGRAADGVPLSSASRDRGTDATGGYIPGIGLRPGQERGHLVAKVLGGLGNSTAHLTPLDNATNTAMRVGPELAVKRFIYEGDPSQSLHYLARAEYDPNGVGGFQSWLVSEAGWAGVPGTAGQRLWTDVRSHNPTLNDVSAAVGLPVTALQYTRVLRALAHYFLAQSINVTIANVNTAPGNTIPIPGNAAITQSVPLP